MVQVGWNSFSGVVPPEIGRLSKLQKLVLTETLLEAKEPKDWDFFCRADKLLTITKFRAGFQLLWRSPS
jgi:hypothetical protein